MQPVNLYCRWCLCSKPGKGAKKSCALRNKHRPDRVYNTETVAQLREVMIISQDAHTIAAYIPHLRRYARALTGDATAADDLVQDTLERAWKRFSLWRPGSDLRPWLFTIMHNVFVNNIRAKRGNQPSRPIEITVAAPQEERLKLRDLNRALRELSPEQREVVLLIGLEQMSYEEAAKILGIPIGTVMSRLSRGREQLRTIINGTVAASQLKVIK